MHVQTHTSQEWGLGKLSTIGILRGRLGTAIQHCNKFVKYRSHHLMQDSVYASEKEIALEDMVGATI